jgi:hypothetical protein
MKKTTTRKYVTVEELDALARERLATHHALETARFSLASEDVRNEIVLSLHRSKSSSLSLLSSSSFNGGENDDVDGKNARENDEAFKRKDALSRKTLKIALCDSSRMMREWLKAREVDLFEERVRLNAVRGLPEEVDFEDGVLFDEEKKSKNTKKKRRKDVIGFRSKSVDD